MHHYRTNRIKNYFQSFTLHNYCKGICCNKWLFDLIDYKNKNMSVQWTMFIEYISKIFIHQFLSIFHQSFVFLDSQPLSSGIEFNTQDKNNIWKAPTSKIVFLRSMVDQKYGRGYLSRSGRNEDTLIKQILWLPKNKIRLKVWRWNSTAYQEVARTSVPSPIRAGWSGRTFDQQKLVPTFPWINNCLMVTRMVTRWDYLEN